MKEKKDPAAVKIFSQINKCEQKIEATMSEEAKEGFSLNQFGSYDRDDLTEAAAQLYGELIEKGLADDYLMYRYAGFLFRSRRFEDASEIYASQLDQNTSAHIMLASVFLAKGDEASARKFLDSYNARCIAESKPFMKSSMEKLRGNS